VNNRFFIRNAKETSSGFTLIELLVVVSIIALLVSILMPALTKAREQAKRAVCSANLHTFGSIAHQYAVENKDYVWPQYTFRRDKSLDSKSFDIDDTSTYNTDYRPRYNCLPYMFRLYIHDLLQETYGMTDETWVCPSQLVYQPHLLDKNGNLPPVNESLLKSTSGWHVSFPPGYNIGYLNLADMHDFNRTWPWPDGPYEPRYVPESPRRTSDKGSKHLSADHNSLWYQAVPFHPDPWHPDNWSHASHRTKTKGSAPAGGNRLHLDGHGEWILPNNMAYQEGDLHDPTVYGKYDHWVVNPGDMHSRNYYW
jgi:prepilin-type N-terminal cleavage/methylation domain-containing protein